MGLENQEVFTNVTVQKPKYELAYYVSYEIAIETNSPYFSFHKSSSRRRYSEFLALHKILTAEFPALKCPSMPPKFLFKDHFDPVFVEERRALLEEFLIKLLSQKIYLSSKALHLFLQSNMTIDEIKEAVKGKDANEIIRENGVLNNRVTDLPLSSTSSVSSFDDNDHRSKDQTENKGGKSSVNNQALSVESSNKLSTGSPQGNKRKVSFCDQVTVAQIHSE